MKAECNQGQVLGFPHIYNIIFPFPQHPVSFPQSSSLQHPLPFSPPYHSETSHIPLVISSPLTYSLKSGPCAPPSIIGGLYAPLPILVSLRPPFRYQGSLCSPFLISVQYAPNSLIRVHPYVPLTLNVSMSPSLIFLVFLCPIPSLLLLIFFYFPFHF